MKRERKIMFNCTVIVERLQEEETIRLTIIRSNTRRMAFDFTPTSGLFLYETIVDEHGEAMHRR